MTKHTPAMPRLRSVLASNFVGALSGTHGVDHYLAAVDASWSLREVRARIVSVRRQTVDTVTVTLVPNANWRGFSAGQYLRVTVDVQGVRHTRCFSPASAAQHSGLLELTCRIDADSVVSRYFASHGIVGQITYLSQAQGEFLLPQPRPENFLFISGGSGITPVMAMLRTLIEEGHSGAITFVHYARDAEHQLYADELAAIARTHSNVRIVCALTQAAGAELQGHFDPAQLDAVAPQWAQTESFVCGPAALMEAVEAAYASRQASRLLHMEHFAAAPLASAVSGGASGEVRYAKSERVASNDGSSLLEQAEAAGMRPECGCRMGICHSCTTRKLSGRVRDLRSGEVSDDSEENIQICVCAPVGTVTLDL